MRKATGLGSKRGSRKKQAPPNDGGAREPREERPYVAPPIEQPPPELTPIHRRKPTAEEAGLTSKNYRMAKELSELRVRNREECKNVSRLTMENMNLASRCREAISHVAMLKKELGMHQRRATETLALQREQTQRVANNLSAEMSRLSQSGSEDDGDRSNVSIDHILSIMPSPSPPRRPKVPPSPSSQSSNMESRAPASPRSNGSPEGVYFSDPDEDDTVADTIADTVTTISPRNEVNAPEPKEAVEPRVFSTPNRHKNPDRWTPKIDNPRESPGLFPHSASPKVVMARRHNYDDEMPRNIIPDPHRSNMVESHSVNDIAEQDDETVASSSSRGSSSSPSVTGSSQHSISQRRDVIGISSIDAFEASFDTTFPSAFTQKDDAERKDLTTGTPTSSEIYNPFSPSPARPSEKTEGPTQASSQTGTQSSLAISAEKPPIAISPEIIRKATVSDVSVFDNPRTPEEKKSNDDSISYDDQYHTPPHEPRIIVNSAGEPRRPEKTVPSSARARYEKALQPRNSSSSSSGQNGKTVPQATLSAEPDYCALPSKEKSHGILRGSPSALLRRIHQRRVNKQMIRQESAPESVSSYVKDNLPHEVVRRQRSAPEPMTNTHKDPAFDARPKVQLNITPEHAPRETIGSFPPAGGNRELLGRENSLNSMSSRSERPFDEMEDGPFAAIPNGVHPSSEHLQNKAARLSALKIRRTVKQPVSYAEPALNTKLRRGDTYFTKPDEQQPQMVTPEQIPQVDPALA